MIRTSKRLLKILCSSFTLVGVLCLAWIANQHADTVIQWIEHLGWFAPFLFIITYAIATLLLLPTMILTLAGGALFGPVYGTLINLVGATSGAACCFLVTRHLIHDWFCKTRSQKVDKLIQNVDNHGWQCVALLRLFPIIPFNLVNYGLGITEISFKIYICVTFIFLIPAEIIYTYFGYAGMDILSKTDVLYTTVWPAVLLVGIILFAMFKYVLKRKR